METSTRGHRLFKPQVCEVTWPAPRLPLVTVFNSSPKEFPVSPPFSHPLSPARITVLAGVKSSIAFRFAQEINPRNCLSAMKRLFRRRNRQKEASCFPQLNSPRGSESSEALPLVVGGSAIHYDTNIPVRSGIGACGVEVCPESPKDYISPANRGERDVGVDLALEPPPAKEQSEQFLLTSLQETREPTPPPVEPTDLSPSHTQKCDDCELERRILWFCRACNLAFCDECWIKQLPHKKNGPGDVVHEKTNTEIAEKVKNVLTPPANEMMREKLHHDDDITAWFGEWFQSPVFGICVNTKIRI